MYPASLDLRDRRAVVIGGGTVATRRALGLVEAGAMVDVIAPVLSERLRRAVVDGLLGWCARPYRRGT